jgi:hypothetical protein
VKVEPDADNVTYTAQSTDESQFIEMKETCPVPITFPVIKSEIQEDRHGILLP